MKPKIIIIGSTGKLGTKLLNYAFKNIDLMMFNFMKLMPLKLFQRKYLRQVHIISGKPIDHNTLHCHLDTRYHSVLSSFTHI